MSEYVHANAVPIQRDPIQRDPNVLDPSVARVKIVSYLAWALD